MTAQATSSGAPMARRPRILILGGTGEAASLTAETAARFAIVYSLAGRTRNPSLPDGVTVRSGGFGGADALAAWLGENDIAAVIDATHPFADRMTAQAVQTCDRAGIPRLKLLRAAWERTAGDDWRRVPDIPAAAALVPKLGRRAFLSVGRQDLAAFAGVENVRQIVRSIDPPDDADRHPDAVYIAGRGPFTTAQESALLRDHDIDVLVSKNAGGSATYPKIAAARAAGIAVIMIDRPAPPPPPIVSDVMAAVTWLDRLTL